jgi:hypothetical protein
MSNVPELIDAMDESISMIQRLAELAPVLDDGGAIYFPHCIELLSLIAQHASHLEKLSTQLTRCVLPPPHTVEERP